MALVLIISFVFQIVQVAFLPTMWEVAPFPRNGSILVGKAKVQDAVQKAGDSGAEMQVALSNAGKAKK